MKEICIGRNSDFNLSAYIDDLILKCKPESLNDNMVYLDEALRSCNLRLKCMKSKALIPSTVERYDGMEALGITLYGNMPLLGGVMD